MAFDTLQCIPNRLRRFVLVSGCSFQTEEKATQCLNIWPILATLEWHIRALHLFPHPELLRNERTPQILLDSEGVLTLHTHCEGLQRTGGKNTPGFVRCLCSFFEASQSCPNIFGKEVQLRATARSYATRLIPGPQLALPPDERYFGAGVER